MCIKRIRCREADVLESCGGGGSAWLKMSQPVAPLAGDKPAAQFDRAVNDTGQPIVLFQGAVLDGGTVARSVLLTDLRDAGLGSQRVEVQATNTQVRRWLQDAPTEFADNVPSENLCEVLNVRLRTPPSSRIHLIW